MRFRIRTIALLLLSYSASLLAADTAGPGGEAALIGRWQPGLTAAIRQLPPSKRTRLTGGGVFEFSEDHRMRMYPKCGREKSEWEKNGVQFLEGEWKITAANQLRIALGALGQKVEKDVEFSLNGDDLIFISAANPHEQYGRFQGDVSRRCR